MSSKAELDQLHAEFLEFRAQTEETIKDLKAQFLELKAEHQENQKKLEELLEKYKDLEDLSSQAWERSVRNRIALQHGFEASQPMRIKTGYDLISAALPGEDSDLISATAAALPDCLVNSILQDSDDE